MEKFKLVYTTLVILFFSLFLSAQEKNVIIDGSITNTSTDIEGIHVLNISSLVATITKNDGTFQISAKQNDTLLISSVQYEIQRIVVTDEIIKTKLLNVRLLIKVNELDEVVVKPHNLSGNLLRDLKEKKTTYEKVRPSKLGLPNAYAKPRTQPERRLYEATSGGGFLPLNPILNAISGRTKKLKNQLKLVRHEQKLTATKEQFDKRLYSEFLKIPEENLDGFIYFCAIDPAFIAIQQADDTILMLEFLKKKSFDYRKINQLE